MFFLCFKSPRGCSEIGSDSVTSRPLHVLAVLDLGGLFLDLQLGLRTSLERRVEFRLFRRIGRNENDLEVVTFRQQLVTQVSVFRDVVVVTVVTLLIGFTFSVQIVLAFRRLLIGRLFFSVVCDVIGTSRQWQSRSRWSRRFRFASVGQTWKMKSNFVIYQNSKTLTLQTHTQIHFKITKSILNVWLKSSRRDVPGRKTLLPFKGRQQKDEMSNSLRNP